MWWSLPASPAHASAINKDEDGGINGKKQNFFKVNKSLRKWRKRIRHCATGYLHIFII